MGVKEALHMGGLPVSPLFCMYLPMSALFWHCPPQLMDGLHVKQAAHVGLHASRIGSAQQAGLYCHKYEGRVGMGQEEALTPFTASAKTFSGASLSNGGPSSTYAVCTCFPPRPYAPLPLRSGPALPRCQHAHCTHMHGDGIRRRGKANGALAERNGQRYVKYTGQ